MYFKNLFTYLIIILSAIESNGLRLPKLALDKRCPTPIVRNGYIKYGFGAKRGRFGCRPGFMLYGPPVIRCSDAKWLQPFPYCIRPGCPKVEDQENGFTLTLNNNATYMVFCMPGYELAGPKRAYCDGQEWDRNTGVCRKLDGIAPDSCDFETADTCGWTTENDWTRTDGAMFRINDNIQMKMYHYGPEVDHTTREALGGHFMLLDSTRGYEGELSRLLSPVYRNDSADAKQGRCFRFYYFMFGEAVNKMRVLYKPVSLRIESIFDSIEDKYLLFERSGPQKTDWIEGIVRLPILNEAFQIVIEGVQGKKGVSDIAIDDVALLSPENCTIEEETKEKSDLFSTPSDEDESAVYRVGSCFNRCNETIHEALSRKDEEGHLTLDCNCIENCFFNCCPDYDDYCNKDDNDDLPMTSTDVNSTPDIEEVSEIEDKNVKSSSTSIRTTAPTPTPTYSPTKVEVPVTLSTPTTIKTTVTPQVTTPTTQITQFTMKKTTPTIKTTPMTSTTPKRITTTIPTVMTTPTTMKTTTKRTTTKRTTTVPPTTVRKTTPSTKMTTKRTTVTTVRTTKTTSKTTSTTSTSTSTTQHTELPMILPPNVNQKKPIDFNYSYISQDFFPNEQNTDASDPITFSIIGLIAVGIICSVCTYTVLIQRRIARRSRHCDDEQGAIPMDRSSVSFVEEGNDATESLIRFNHKKGKKSENKSTHYSIADDQLDFSLQTISDDNFSENEALITDLDH